MNLQAFGGEGGEADHEKVVLMQSLQLCLFILSVYGGGYLMRYMQGPALVAEILVGLLFKSMHWFPDAGGFDEAFVALGQVGLLLMIFDGGVHMDLAMLRKVGARAVMLAVTGCFVPVLLVWVVFQFGFGYEQLPAIAAGTALSSTAIGFTVQVLNDNGILQTYLGQLIMAGAMLDDVISLILLAMLNGMKTGHVTAMDIILPLLTSAAVMVCGFVVRMVFVCIDSKTKLTDRLTPEETVQVERKRVFVYIVGMLLAAIGVTWLADFVNSSYLLGAFMSGMIATTWPHFQDVWDELCEPVLPWLCRCFFACTVGFAVPVKALAGGAPWLIVATIAIAMFSKFITGVFAAGPRDPNFLAYSMQVGTAMIGRGELGFVQIDAAFKGGILGIPDEPMTQNAFGAIVWALLIASLAGPVLFRLTLKMQPRASEADGPKESFVLTYNSGNVQDTEAGLPRLLANTAVVDTGAVKKEKLADTDASSGQPVC
jgi:Kef-type K+ transport system membrane component KefB